MIDFKEKIRVSYKHILLLPLLLSLFLLVFKLIDRNNVIESTDFFLDKPVFLYLDFGYSTFPDISRPIGLGDYSDEWDEVYLGRDGGHWNIIGRGNPVHADSISFNFLHPENPQSAEEASNFYENELVERYEKLNSALGDFERELKGSKDFRSWEHETPITQAEIDRYQLRCIGGNEEGCDYWLYAAQMGQYAWIIEFRGQFASPTGWGLPLEEFERVIITIESEFARWFEEDTYPMSEFPDDWETYPERDEQR